MTELTEQAQSTQPQGEVWVRYAVTPDGPSAREVTRAASGVGHQVAADLVAHGLGVAVADVRLGRRCNCGSEEHGRPIVLSHPEVHVSITHCVGHVVVALTRVGPVGVDLEVLRDIDHVTVGHKVVGPLDDPVSDTAQFLRAWVRKEAVVKATGDGVTVPLDQVGVAGAAVIGPRIPYCGSEIQGYITDLETPATHYAAVAVLGGAPPRIVVVD